MLAALPHFILVVDHERVIRYINRVEPGYDRDEVIGAPVGDFLFPGSLEELDEAMDAALRTGEEQEFDVEAEMADGSREWYRSELLPLREGGEVFGVVICATNVTELKAAEEEAERYRRLLPICSWCDRIQGDDGEWTSVETYLRETTDTAVSHGMCPDCYERHVEEHGQGGPGTNGSVA